MSRTWKLAAVVLLLAACKKAEDQAAPADTVFTGLVIADSFKTPESVLYDAAGDVYLVANINGAPAGKDDNGFISRVNSDGRVDQIAFIDGADSAVTLNAPKGMAIRGDTLFVADIEEVRLFSRVNGAPLGSWRVPGATFLNDMHVGPDGTVYVTDSGWNPDFSPNGSDAVWRFDATGRAVAVARGRSLGGPNGIIATDSGVVIAANNGDVYRLSASGVRTDLPKPPAGGLDGLLRLANGAWLVSSWNDSTVRRLAPGDTTWVMIIRSATPADIGYDTRRHRMLIPVFERNRVSVEPLGN